MTSIISTQSFKRRRKSPLIVVCAALWIALLLAGSFAATLVKPQQYNAVDLRARLAAPTFSLTGRSHVLGTDDLGRDQFLRLIVSIKTTMIITMAGVFIGAIVGILLGFIAAHFGGLIDEGVMLLVDIQAALPFLVVALGAIALFGGSYALLIVIVGLHGWERYARLTRGLTLALTGQVFITAARTSGLGQFRIYWRHMLPNIAGPLLVTFSMSLPEIMLLESSLSFLGLGVQPPETSLGSMLGYGRAFLLNAWWIAAAPALVIFLSALSMSILGDWVRDRVDPTLRND